MWKSFLWINFCFPTVFHSLCKSFSFQQEACAKKVDAALNENPLFHIKIPYCCYNYLFISFYIIFL